jgi:hemerythrin
MLKYTLEQVFNLLNNHFTDEINKMKLFLDIKNHPEYLKKKMIHRQVFKHLTENLDNIGLNEFSPELKASLFKMIAIHTLVDNKDLQELIINFLGQL